MTIRIVIPALVSIAVLGCNPARKPAADMEMRHATHHHRVYRSGGDYDGSRRPRGRDSHRKHRVALLPVVEEGCSIAPA